MSFGIGSCVGTLANQRLPGVGFAIVGDIVSPPIPPPEPIPGETTSPPTMLKSGPEAT